MEPTCPCASPDARSSRTGGARLGRRAPRGMAQRGLRRMESSSCNRVRRRVEKRDFRVSRATGKRRLITPYSYVRLKSHTRRILRSFRPTLKLIGKFNPSIDRRTSKFPSAAFDFRSQSHLRTLFFPTNFPKRFARGGANRAHSRARSHATRRPRFRPTADRTDRTHDPRDGAGARRTRDARRARWLQVRCGFKKQENTRPAPKTERSDAAGFERRVRALRPANPRPLERRR